MPYTWQDKHIKLGKYDRRLSSLTEEDKEDIKRLHNEGIAIRAIARKYLHKCSRRLITFIIYPERLRALQEANKKAHHWRKYYNRKKLTIATRAWRNYKQNLIKNKII